MVSIFLVLSFTGSEKSLVKRLFLFKNKNYFYVLFMLLIIDMSRASIPTLFFNMFTIIISININVCNLS